MIRTSIRLLSACAAAALVCGISPSIAGQPSGFNLPPPAPTPTPAPEGPADERAGYAIPPRAAPAPVASPSISPLPIPTPTAAPTPVPTPLAIPAPTTSPRPAASASPRSATTPAQPSASASGTAADPARQPGPAQPAAAAPTPPAQVLPEAAPSPTTSPAADAAAPLALPSWWPWAAGGLGGLAVLIGALTLWRRRKPGVLRLAPPPPGMESTAPVPALPRLDLSMEVTGATRSLMMFTISYRLSLANRTDQAVSDLQVAVQLACARRNESNAASPGAAQQLGQVERIGPHQSRSISGEVQLPLSAITPLRQGKVPLFIPLLHLTIEGEGQQALNRSFVIGTPSTASTARLHPISLDTPPGSITGLRAQAVDAPAVSAAA